MAEKEKDSERRENGGIREEKRSLYQRGEREGGREVLWESKWWESNRGRGEEIKRTGEGGERERERYRKKWEKTEKERIIAVGKDGRKISENRIWKVKSVWMCVVRVLKGISERKKKENSTHWGKGRKRENGRKRKIERVSPEKDTKESDAKLWIKTNNNIMKYAKKFYNIQQRQSQEANQMWAMLWLLNWYAAPLNVLMNKGSLTHI